MSAISSQPGAYAPPSPYMPPGSHPGSSMWSPGSSMRGSAMMTPAMLGNATPSFSAELYTGNSIANLPMGMQQLNTMPGIKIKQHVELLEVLTPLEISNVYDLMEPFKRMPIFRGEEKSNCCARNCCGKYRGFDMRICDLNDQTLFICRRQFSCCVCMFTCDCLDWCCDLCKDRIDVFGNDGERYGHIEESGNCCCKVRYTIHDKRGNKIYTCIGPCCEATCPCFCPRANFKVYSFHSGNQCGLIYKQWANVIQEVVSDADNFGIEFPVDCDVKLKAVLIGAVFLIDMKHFQKD